MSITTSNFNRRGQYAPSPQYLLLSKPKEPLAVYLPLTIDCVRMKQWAEERGFKTAAILGKNTKNYTVSVSDATVRQQIEENGTIPEWVDVLIFDYSLDINVAINHGHIKRLYADKSPTIHHLFKYNMEVYNHQNWEEWQEANFPAYKKIPVADKKLWHDAMGFSKWKDWKEELESKGYTVRTKKGVVEIAANSTPTPAPTSYLIFTGPKGIDVVDEPLEGMVEVIGVQKDMWFTKKQLEYVYGFWGVAARDYAKVIGCEFVSAQKQFYGKRVRVHAFVTKQQEPAPYTLALINYTHPQHLAEVERIHQFIQRPFEAERYTNLFLR